MSRGLVGSAERKRPCAGTGSRASSSALVEGYTGRLRGGGEMRREKVPGKIQRVANEGNSIITASVFSATVSWAESRPLRTRVKQSRSSRLAGLMLSFLDSREEFLGVAADLHGGLCP